MLPDTVHLEVDVLRHMHEWMPIETAIEVAMENAIAILPNFLKREMNVVFDYPLDLFWYDYILKGVEGAEAKIHTFTLCPNLDVVMQNRGTREISPALSERIRISLRYRYERSVHRHIH